MFHEDKRFDLILECLGQLSAIVTFDPDSTTTPFHDPAEVMTSDPGLKRSVCFWGGRSWMEPSRP